MKTLLKTLGIVIFAMTCQSCSLDNDPQDDGNHRLHQDKTRKVYQFKLSLGGDYVEQSEEPLMRASEPNTYVGINVTCKDKSLVDAPTENYAYGVFTSKDNITIDLISGYTYDFEATILRDGTDKYDTELSGYRQPFRYYQDYKPEFEPAFYEKKKLNNFQYSYIDPSNILKGYLCDLKLGPTSVILEDQDLSSNSITSYPRVHRYYGTLSDIDPSTLGDIDDTILIPCDYKCFGIKIIINELPDNTSLTVKDVNLTNANIALNDKNNGYPFLMFPKDLVFDSTTPEWEDIYCVKNLVSDTPTSFELVFTWDRGMGKKETFKTSFDITPKNQKILVIKVNGSASTQVSGNISFETTGDENLTPDTETINYNSVGSN